MEAKDRDDAVNRVLEITDENEELEKNSTTLSGYAESIAVERDEIALQLESWKIEVCRLLDDEDENAKENWLIGGVLRYLFNTVLYF